MSSLDCRMFYINAKIELVKRAVVVLRKFEEARHPRDEKGRWANSDGAELFYHGTTSNVLNRILRQGLKISRGGKGGESSLFSSEQDYEGSWNRGRIFVSRDLGTAFFYAHQNRMNSKRPRPIILRLRVPKNVVDKGVDTKASVWWHETAFKTDIKPEWIKAWTVAPDHHDTRKVPKMHFQSVRKAVNDGGVIFYLVLIEDK